MIFRKLTIDDREQLNKLIDITFKNLKNIKFFLPINKCTRDNFFNNNYMDFYGLFINNQLIGAAALIYDKKEFKSIVEHAKIDLENIAEIGLVMIHPSYKGVGLSFDLCNNLVKIANKDEIKNIICTIHPNNTPSQRTFKKLGFIKLSTFEKIKGYSRDILILEL